MNRMTPYTLHYRGVILSRKKEKRMKSGRNKMKIEVKDGTRKEGRENEEEGGKKEK